jgi:hypothetical protein
MFGYAPTVNDNSGAIRGQGIVNSAQMNAQAKVQLANDIGGALVSLAGAYGNASGDRKKEKDKFTGMYDFLSQNNMVSPSAQTAIDGFIKKNDYAAANAYIAPYLAELDFGRRAMLAGRSGFFDGSGNWQMAMPAQAVEPRNKYNYTVGGGS